MLLGVFCSVDMVVDSVPAITMVALRHQSFHQKPKPEIFQICTTATNNAIANHSSARSSVAELAKEEAYMPREKEGERIPRDWIYTDVPPKTHHNGKNHYLQPANKVDDPNLHNPLIRQERLGCGWLGAIFEWEGVIVDDEDSSSKSERRAWLVLSKEEYKSPPSTILLNRIEGMKNEQALSEVLCWSRDTEELQRLATRKEEIHRTLHSGLYRLRPGSQQFMTVLSKHNIPTAVASTRPKRFIKEAVESVGVEWDFDAIIGAEDVYRGKPDPKMFIYAAQKLNLIPERCIVFGNSNLTVEAAHDARMKCVAVASRHPLYELSAADLVVRHLSELSVVNLKKLAAIESPESGSEELEAEMEKEEASIW
ncbi:HAD-superfamily hydrolase subfamily IA, variant 3:Beta-phosphoglucomutasehydrolase [Zostera marina]|uniref:HAD-superfamily hydrolase subfamily IA, variant 3:Beta-phosphoglucomutasehydrolase n=1 Tax=Zostera marina TaxID=29655 RepID=A0A0K9PZS6_ZOSMR|nr:HAD-superfamily hydrolase subfamily IA, variant 3:Beta-phosphoglucomutasehydrolase [Zostera marina]